MSYSDVEQYLINFYKSRLIPREKLTAALEEFKQQNQIRKKSELDVEKLGAFFIERNLLTDWQHQKLTSGHFRGFLLGKYRLLRHLGAGGMSNVYLAEHQHMRRKVAIKVLPKAMEKNETLLQRFYREAEAIASLDHPNIVQAYHFDNDGDTHYIVMQFIEGCDLQRQVEDHGPLDTITATYYISQAARGLAHVHSRGLIHRDIKPGNLMVDPEGTVKLMDLGLAQITFQESRLTTEQKGAVIGTADYLAPEQAVDSHNIDARADQYSLGATFYFLLAGCPPFPTGTIAQRLVKHQLEEPQPLEEFRTDLGEGLTGVIHKMMRKKPEQRYESMEEIAAVLEEWLANQDRDEVQSRTSMAGLTAVDLESLEEFDTDKEAEKFASDADISNFGLSEMFESSGRISSVKMAASEEAKSSGTMKWLVIAALLCLLIGGGVWFSGFIPIEWEKPAGELVLKWPEDQREQAILRINEEAQPVAAQGTMRFSLAPGEYQIEIYRQGYQPFRTQAALALNEITTITPTWELTEESKGFRIFGELKGRVEGFLEAPAELTQLPWLLQELDAFQATTTDKYLKRDARQLSSQLKKIGVPWDKLEYQAIPSIYKSSSYLGPLVGILGRSGKRMDHPSPVYCAAYHPNGSQVIGCSARQAPILWEHSEPQAEFSLPEEVTFPNQQYRGMALTAGNTLLVATGFEPNEEGSLWAIGCWNLDSQAFLGSMTHELAEPIRLFGALEDSFVVSQHIDGTYARWNTTTLQLEGEPLPPPEGLGMSEVSLDGKMVVYGNRSRELLLRNWEGNSTPLQVPALDSILRWMRFDHSGKLYCCGRKGKVLSWDPAEQVWSEPIDLADNEQELRFFDLTSDGTKAITVTERRILRLHDLATQDVRFEKYLGPSAQELEPKQLHPAGTEFLFAYQTTRQLLGFPLSTESETEAGHICPTLAAVAFTPDGKSLLTAATDRQLIRWDAATAEGELGIFPESASRAVAWERMVFSPDAKHLAWIEKDGQFRVLDTQSLQVTYEKNWFTTVEAFPQVWALLPAGSKLLMGALDSETGKQRLGLYPLSPDASPEFQIDGFESFQALRLHPDGKHVALAGMKDGKLVLQTYRLADGSVVTTFPTTVPEVVSLNFSPQGDLLATASENGQIQVWDTVRGELQQSLNHLNRAARAAFFTPDSSRLIGEFDFGRIVIWELPQQEEDEVRELSVIQAPRPGVPRKYSGWNAPPILSPEGRHLALPNGDGSVCLYRLSDVPGY